ncbi:MAG: hypothetical protein EHM28_13380, partial [Spirochaetaceae bacterium]
NLFLPGNLNPAIERFPVPVYFENTKWRLFSNLIWTGLQIILLIILLVIGASTHPAFISIRNFEQIFKSFLYLALPTMAMLVIFSNGSIDLSVSAIAALTGFVTAIVGLNVNPVAGILVGLFAALCIGIVTGLFTGWLRLPGFLVTFTVALAVQSLLLFFSSINNGEMIILNDWPASIDWFGWFIILPLTFFTFLWLQFPALNNRRKTETGIQKESGSKSNLRIGLPYVLSSLAAGIYGILMITWMKAVPQFLRTNLEFQIILAIVLSGTCFYSRFGNVAGVLFSIMTIVLVNQLFLLIGMDMAIMNILLTVLLVNGIGFLYLYHTVVGMLYRRAGKKTATD